MTVTEAEKRVNAILLNATDPERAHRLEDELRSDFLKWMSETGGSVEAPLIARILLTTEDAFEHWCA